jgi:hypothetical protein
MQNRDVLLSKNILSEEKQVGKKGKLNQKMLIG